jgi:hypothetical protein
MRLLFATLLSLCLFVGTLAHTPTVLITGSNRGIGGELDCFQGGDVLSEKACLHQDKWSHVVCTYREGHGQAACCGREPRDNDLPEPRVV